MANFNAKKNIIGLHVSVTFLCAPVSKHLQFRRIIYSFTTFKLVLLFLDFPASVALSATGWVCP